MHWPVNGTAMSAVAANDVPAAYGMQWDSVQLVANGVDHVPGGHTLHTPFQRKVPAAQLVVVTVPYAQLRTLPRLVDETSHNPGKAPVLVAAGATPDKVLTGVGNVGAVATGDMVCTAFW